MTAPDPFRCICNPADLFEPPDPTPRTVEGCPAHQARLAYQQFSLRLDSSERRICGHEQEPDGHLCVGWLNFEPGDVQAKCTACGGWEGRWAPRKTTTCCDMHDRHCEPSADLCCRDCTEAAHPFHPRGVTCVMDADS